MDKEAELKAAKKMPLRLLLAATLMFVATAILHKNFWIDGLKTISEAAVVGAFADWFAVVALFKEIPIRFVSAHTNIISNNQVKIADNLAAFVKEKFLDAASLVELIRKHDPAQKIADWLSAPVNARILGDYLVKLVSGLLDVTDDARIQGFMKSGLHAVLAKIDLSKSIGTVLDTLTKDGRHQQLLDEGIKHLLSLLDEPGSRRFITDLIIDWLQRKLPLMEKVWPSAALALGEIGAKEVADLLNQWLMQIKDDPAHALRRKFDDAVQRLIDQLKSDPAFLQKGEEIKRYLRDGETFNLYIKNLWDALRDWLKQDIASSDSQLHEKAVAMGKWVGRELTKNPELLRSLNDHMENWALAIAPDFSQFLTRHISDTVKKWDAKDMSRQIELNIGKDLQYIRINGTIVGGIIGLLLYLSSRLIDFLQAYFA